MVPVYNNLELTLECLASIREHTACELLEVVVVDDGSTDGTPDALSRIPGLRVLRHDYNRGFVDAVITGAGAATGELLFFLNNDARVQRGWLEALLATVKDISDAGAVGCKLLFDDGRLQEAGGVIWQDGTAWNLGRLRDADLPEFNYRRDVDYCSAAALLVTRSAFQAAGGWDSRFAPGYYEDADLCFKIRAAGYRVIYEPRAEVVHRLGASYGDDLDGAGAIGEHRSDAMVAVNRHLFKSKWSMELDHHWPVGTADGLLGGRMDGRVRVLVADHVVPAHDGGSGDLRMTWIVRLLADLGCAVTFAPWRGVRRQPYTHELERLGVEVLAPSNASQVLKSRVGIYDLALLSQAQVARDLLPVVRASNRRAVVVFDTAGVGYAGDRRPTAALNGQSGPDPEEMQRLQLLMARRSDLVAVAAEDEAGVLHGQLPQVETILLPNVDPPVPTSTPSVEETSSPEGLRSRLEELLLRVGSHGFPALERRRGPSIDNTGPFSHTAPA